MKYIKTYEELEDKSIIRELDYYRKNLSELPDLSEYINLKYLYCSNNNLTELPELPQSIVILDCENNKLTSLPKELPKSLKKLHCQYNKLPYTDLNGYYEWLTTVTTQKI